MLFDLQGKRRRTVQATYLVLAVLMGGGLVLFGIGSGTDSGGLFDAISGNGGGSANSQIEKRIERNEKAVKLNPSNTRALADLVRSHYQLASDDTDQTGSFGAEGKAELAKASSAWQRYVDAAEKPDPSLAGLMLNAYGEFGLNKASEAAGVAELVADARPSAAAYLQLAQYAAKAGQTRKATLAGKKAVDLAPKSQKKLVKQQVEAAVSGGVTAGAG
jgi:hypothetical protein